MYEFIETFLNRCLNTFEHINLIIIFIPILTTLNKLTTFLNAAVCLCRIAL